MIGFYNYSVILTYIGLISTVFGILVSIEGSPQIGIICLMISGVCDMFDGKIARAMTRTDDEKVFGIQIDSLCDLVCFGVFPVVLAHSFGLRGIFNNVLMAFFVLAAVIRLGYFNVTEQKRQQETDECRTYYQGLPVTSIAVLFPLLYLAKDNLDYLFLPAISAMLLGVECLYIADIKIPKPNTRMLIGFMMAGTFFLLRFFHLA